MSIDTQKTFQQIETNIYKTEKNIKKAEAFDKIGEIAVKKGCLKIRANESELDVLKQKKFEILKPILAGLGLLGLAATVAVLATVIIASTTNPLLFIFTLELAIMAFAVTFFGGLVFSVCALADFGKKYQTQGRIIKLYDEIDNAKTYLKANAEKIRNWVEAQQSGIESQLKAFDKGKLPTLNVTGLKERLKLCQDLTAILPKVAISTK